jgi:hypothetical protein
LIIDCKALHSSPIGHVARAFPAHPQFEPQSRFIHIQNINKMFFTIRTHKPQKKNGQYKVRDISNVIT